MKPAAASGAGPQGPAPWVFFLAFTVSGFAGLIYESIWSHYLRLFLGHAAYAQSLVLGIFMGGLALGSALASRFSTGIRRPILAYALVEGLIGLFALSFHDAFVWMTELFHARLLPEIGSPAAAAVLKWLAAGLLIGPPAILLGTTFPLMTAGVVRRFPQVRGGVLAMLYFTNSIGAAVGVLASGFVLIRLVGLPGTVAIAGLLNLLLALGVGWLVRSGAEGVGEPIRAARDAGDRGDDATALLTIAACVTGASSFVYEIAWIRMLSLVLGSATHSFELMLSAFITGLAFGGLYVKRWIDSLERPLRFAGFVQIAMGLAAVLTLPVYAASFDWMAALLAWVPRNDPGYLVYSLSSHAIAMAVMLPTTFFAGMTLPLFTDSLMRSGGGERAIGRIYASNTVGAIAGVVFAVHVGLPVLGLEALIALGAALDIALGVWLLARSLRGERPALVAGAALAAAAVFAAVIGFARLDPRRLVSGVFIYGSAEINADSEVVYYADGKTASVGLVRGSAGTLTINKNGKSDAQIQMAPGSPPSQDEPTQVLVAALPLAYAPEARRVAVIGMGSGQTTHTLLADERLESVDTIEIERKVLEAARGFGERVARAYADPRSHLHVEDAKTWFSLQARRYDAIIAEPSNPWMSGVSSLFSREFYRNVRTHLAPGGVLVQWLHTYSFDDALVASVLRALSPHFDDWVVYSADDGDALIVARTSGPIGAADFDRLFSGGIGAELARIGLSGPDDLIVRKLGGKALIESRFRHVPAPPNSDYYPFLDLGAPLALFRNERATALLSWGLMPLPVLDLMGPEQLDPRRVHASPASLRTLRVSVAGSIHAALVRGERPGEDSGLTGALAEAVEYVRQRTEGCRMREDEAGFGAAWHRVASAALPNLAPAQGRELILSALPDACLPGLSPEIAELRDFQLAVAARDARGMAAAGEHLLARAGRLEEGQRHYVEAGTLLGYTASGRAGEALERWQSWNRDARTVQVPIGLSMVLELAATQRAREAGAPGP